MNSGRMRIKEPQAVLTKFSLLGLEIGEDFATQHARLTRPVRAEQL
jgi:hypothetical protein